MTEGPKKNEYPSYRIVESGLGGVGWGRGARDLRRGEGLTSKPDALCDTRACRELLDHVCSPQQAREPGTWDYCAAV